MFWKPHNSLVFYLEIAIYIFVIIEK